MQNREGESLIFIDEMGIRAADCKRPFARSLSGTKAAVPAAAHNTGERGIKWHFLCALGIEGMLDCSYFLTGSMNSQVFEEWVEVLLIP